MCLVSQAYHDGMEQTDLQHLWKNKDGHTFLCYSSHQKESVSTVFESALLLSHFSHVRLCATPQTAAQQAPLATDSPGKNTGVGCHFLLQFNH